MKKTRICAYCGKEFLARRGMQKYFQYLDSVYCIPENVEKRKMYWKKAHIAQ